MLRQPRPPAASILDKKVITHVSWIGVLIAVITLAAGVYYHHPASPQDTTWQTMIFSTLAFAQIGQAFGMRAAGHSPFSITSNRVFTIMTVLTFGLQLAVIYLPFMKQFFKLTPLTLPQLAGSFLMGALVFIAIQIEKARR
jgi:Ca2+-transporting ATPase